MVLEMVRMKEEEEAEEAAEAQQRVAERVGGLKADEEVAFEERMKAQWNGEDVGWSSLAEETNLQAPPGTTDEKLKQHLKANYDADTLAKLQNIDLSNTQVTDAAVTALANACPGLQSIVLSDTQVTDAGATALASACPGLRSIVLSNTQVTDAAATALAKGCPGLQHIDLSNTQVTPSLAKWWDSDVTAEDKQHPRYGGTIADFRKQLRRVTNKKQGKGKKKRR
jgi:Leucine-rich repeat (LRR) protein